MFLFGDAGELVGDEIDGVDALAGLFVTALPDTPADVKQVAYAVFCDPLAVLAEEGDAVEMGVVLPFIGVFFLPAIIGGDIDADSGAGGVDLCDMPWMANSAQLRIVIFLAARFAFKAFIYVLYHLRNTCTAFAEIVAAVPLYMDQQT